MHFSAYLFKKDFEDGKTKMLVLRLKLNKLKVYSLPLDIRIHHYMRLYPS